MASLDPKTGDILTLANARWAVIYAQGPELRLLRLNEIPEPEPEQPKFAPNAMTVDEVADELGIAPKTVREYCKTGQLKGRKVGQVWRILRSENPMLALA
ncbi:MAG: helix-turn-helix domain-containing protein [Eggerthellaceae bacterium]|nr:helix-turn-helix domain-containing protein [Eggerthellaceae bacterium]